MCVWGCVCECVWSRLIFLPNSWLCSNGSVLPAVLVGWKILYPAHTQKAHLSLSLALFTRKFLPSRQKPSTLPQGEPHKNQTHTGRKRIQNAAAAATRRGLDRPLAISLPPTRTHRCVSAGGRAASSMADKTHHQALNRSFLSLAHTCFPFPLRAFVLNSALSFSFFLSRARFPLSSCCTHTQERARGHTQREEESVVPARVDGCWDGFQTSLASPRCLQLLPLPIPPRVREGFVSCFFISTASQPFLNAIVN